MCSSPLVAVFNNRKRTRLGWLKYQSQRYWSLFDTLEQCDRRFQDFRGEIKIIFDDSYATALTRNNPFLAFNNEGNICDYIHVRFIRVIAIYAPVDRPLPVIL